MTQDPNQEFRPINRILGAQPSLGPIPSHLVLPWTGIALFSYFICQGVLSLGWLITGFVAAWGMSTWWILTGDKSWHFLSKFVPTPKWTRGMAKYESFLERGYYEEKNRLKKHRRRSK
ncbi:MAG TPA: hypothetical protein DDW76_34745 [Cyanobacteria bacterium UBA11369]|nr:hypothetical protein [Cyanobacteria bacterium UBA11371]HBE34712.1 hypothetical protein [Cyanobacteria bacterium UBA11368]HBE53771.1 hypothetical protein [Cyanobacteria bacterium UBA11369]